MTKTKLDSGDSHLTRCRNGEGTALSSLGCAIRIAGFLSKLVTADFPWRTAHEGLKTKSAWNCGRADLAL